MRFSSALTIGLAALSLTFCNRKGRDQVNPGTATPQTEKVASTSVVTYDYVIQTNEQVVDANTLKLSPGAVIGIASGTRGPLILKNFKGTVDKPFLFINKGGKVSIDCPASLSYGLKTYDCQFFRITGSGDPNTQYGINVNGANIGVQLDYLSSNFEVDALEVHNTDFCGLMAKTDPSCDPATQRGNFTMRNIKIHDNYMHNTGAEGFYIGNSFYQNGHTLSCGVVLPHSIEGCLVYNNITKSTGCEGIQVGCAISGCEIYGNNVQNFGTSPFAPDQNNGIQVGEGTGGLLYNNFIKDGPGNGIIMLGLGDNIAFNNVVINPATYGVFCDERYTPDHGFTFVNNTIVNPGKDGFMLYSEKVPMNTVENNIIVVTGNNQYIGTISGVKLTQSHNYTTKNIGDVKFKAVSSNDYSLLAGSPAIDKGMDETSLGVTFDFNHISRPQGAAFDIGAFEMKSGSSRSTTGSSGTGSSTSGGGSTSSSGTGTTTPGGGGGIQASGPIVTSFTLIDASNNSDLFQIKDGTEINLSRLSTSKFNFRVNTSPTTVGSVRISVNGKENVQSIVPYSAFGDVAGVFNPETLQPGNYVITAVPYTEANAQGDAGISLTAKFTVTGQSSSTSTSSFSVTPVDDAYLQFGKVNNSNLLSVYRNERTTYMKFVVDKLGNTPATKAKLRFKIGSSSGYGNVTVSLGNSNNWTQTNLSDANKPSPVKTVGSINTTYSTGQSYEVDVTPAITGDGTYTLILKQDPNGKLFTFSSSEGWSSPELIIN